MAQYLYRPSENNYGSNFGASDKTGLIYLAPAITISPPAQASPKSEDEFSISKIVTLVLSLIAIAVSVNTALYTRKKDTKARKHSIDDDYWLRKIVSPIAIEPMLKGLLEMIALCPSDCSGSDFSAPEISTYHTNSVKKITEFSINFGALSLISEQLALAAATSIDEIQDILIQYCYHNQNSAKNAAGAPVISRSEFQQDFRSKLISTLKIIKSYQLELG